VQIAAAVRERLDRVSEQRGIIVLRNGPSRRPRSRAVTVGSSFMLKMTSRASGSRSMIRRRSSNLRDPALAGLVMSVADDGRGLNGEREAGMGLAGMRDRVRLMGGSVKIDSPQGGGVVVEACFTALRANHDAGKHPGIIRKLARDNI
jgi:two-component sensor histidine kinase